MRLRQNLSRAVGQERRADARAESGRLAQRRAPVCPQRTAAIERDDGRHKLQRVIVDQRRQRADRCLAAAAERSHERALRVEGGACLGVVDAGDRLLYRAIIAGPNLDGDDTLSGGRHARGRRQSERNTRREAEAPQPGRRQHQRIVLAGVQLAKTRVEVAADRRETGRRKDAHDASAALRS